MIVLAFLAPLQHMHRETHEQAHKFTAPHVCENKLDLAVFLWTRLLKVRGRHTLSRYREHFSQWLESSPVCLHNSDYL